MTSALLLAIFSLYPWNLGVNGFYTIGNYSNNQDYVSKSIYLSLDRISRDSFTAGYEKLTIDGNFDFYEQESVIMRSVSWIKPEIRIGFLAGLVQSNSIWEGWLLGSQMEGDLPWFGYALDYSYLDLQWLDNVTLDTLRHPATQWGLTISRFLRSHIAHFRIASCNSETRSRLMYSSGIRISLRSGTYLDSGIRWNEGRFYLDPYLLLVDNNADVLKRSYKMKLTHRMFTNLSATVGWSMNYYTSVVQSIYFDDYHVQYWTAGLLFRI